MLKIVPPKASSDQLPLLDANELAAFALSILPDDPVIDEPIFPYMFMVQSCRSIWAFENLGHGSLASRAL